MNILFLIFYATFLIIVCITLIVLLWATTLDFIKDTEFRKWVLQKIKSKWR